MRRTCYDLNTKNHVNINPKMGRCLFLAMDKTNWILTPDQDKVGLIKTWLDELIANKEESIKDIERKRFIEKEIFDIIALMQDVND